MLLFSTRYTEGAEYRPDECPNIRQRGYGCTGNRQLLQWIAVVTARNARFQLPPGPKMILRQTLPQDLASELPRHFYRRPRQPLSRPPPSPTTPRRLSSARLRRVVDYVRGHLADNLTLVPVADVAGMTPHHFARLFKAATGMLPYRFVLLQRISRAGTLL